MDENSPGSSASDNPPPSYSSLSMTYVPLSEVENLLTYLLVDLRGSALSCLYHFCRKYNLRKLATQIEEMIFVSKNHLYVPGKLRSVSSTHLERRKFLPERQVQGLTFNMKSRTYDFEKIGSQTEQHNTTDTSMESVYCVLLSYSDLTDETVGFVVNIRKPCEIIRYLPAPSIELGPEFASSLHCNGGQIRLYLSGGKGHAASCLLEYRFGEMKWICLKRMSNGRSRHSMTILDRTLYVVGGIHNGREVPVIEGYSITRGKWVKSCRMKIPVRTASCCVYGKKIYIFGGKAGSRRFSAVQTFDPETNSCDAVLTLPCDCSSGQCLRAGDKIFIATGQGQMIIFDPQTCVSRILEPQFLCKRHFGMVFSGNEILLVGGKFAANTELACIDQYSISHNRWTRVGHLVKPCRYMEPIFFPGRDIYMYSTAIVDGTESTR